MSDHSHSDRHSEASAAQTAPSYAREPRARLTLWQAAYVVARRDFLAVLLSRAFLFFLMGPLLIGVIAGASGMLGARIGEQAASVEGQADIGLTMSRAQSEAMIAARAKLVDELGLDIPPMEWVKPAASADMAEDAASDGQHQRYLLTVGGSLNAPQLTGPAEEVESLKPMIALTAATAAGTAPTRYPPLQARIVAEDAQSGTSAKAGRLLTAQAGQMVLFLLTMLLASMVLSNMVEEKTNKVIEILAAAIPMDAVFIGKLFAMLGVSVFGIAVWGAFGFAALALAGGPVGQLPVPATGWPAFIALGVVYFVMAYLLLGSLFLTIGSLAATVREVQTLSMPVTMLQVGVFFLASFSVAHLHSTAEWIAVIFPLSSPYAMVARAAQEGGLLQHGLAILYQALWVGLTVHFGARLFRRRVMQSGPQRVGRLKRWWQQRRGAA